MRSNDLKGAVMIAPEQLSLAIARNWSTIEATFSESDWKSFSGRLTMFLRQLDDQVLDATPVIESIQALFDEHPNAATVLAVATKLLESQESSPPQGSPPALDSPFSKRLRAPSRRVLIDILYGTDREVAS